MSKVSLIGSGLIGLFGAFLVTAACIAVMVQGLIPVLLTWPMLVWGGYSFLLIITLLEIPVMIISMRRMGDSDNPRAQYLVILTNGLYVFFAAAYAAPFILLTGQSWLELAAGAALGGLSLVRFVSSLVLLPGNS